MEKIIKQFSINKIIIIKLLLLICVIEIIVVANSPKSIEYYTNKVVSACEYSQEANDCYLDEIPKLMEKISMEDTFLVIEKAQEKDERFWYCHILSHKISGIEVGKNQSDWKNTLRRCPSHQCGNGCLHGTFIARFQSYDLSNQQIDEITPEFKQVCTPTGSWNPSEEELASCRHSIGHSLIFLSNADLKIAINVCDRIEVSNKEDYTENCYEGIFMQIFQPRAQEEIDLVSRIMPTKDTAVEFCSQFRDDIKDICLKEIWVLFEKEVFTPEGLTNFCSYSNNPEEIARCYKKLFYIIMSKLNFYDSSSGKDQYFQLCSGLSPQWSQACIDITKNGTPGRN